jgi:hypothetical protein
MDYGRGCRLSPRRHHLSVDNFHLSRRRKIRFHSRGRLVNPIFFHVAAVVTLFANQPRSVIMSRSLDEAKHASWAARLRRFASSGLGVREFCRREGLSEPNFYFWRKRLSGPMATRADAGGMRHGPEPLFLPVRIVPEVSSGGGRGQCVNVEHGPVQQAHGGRIDLLLGGVTVRLRGDVPAQRLAEVLAVLDRRGGHSC